MVRLQIYNFELFFTRTAEIENESPKCYIKSKYPNNPITLVTVLR